MTIPGGKMDPDQLRKRIIELANLVISYHGMDNHDSFVALSIDLAEAVHDMDEWLRKGGFYPDVWATFSNNVGRRHDV